jgi:hypothetical protein
MPRNPKKPQAKKPPARKPSKKAPAKKPRTPTNRNNNSVRVHIINSSGGESAPPPYSGPDRSSFAFNPVFDMGGPKAQMLPPMNSGVPISESPVKRVSEIQTQAGDGIFDRFVAGTNPSMSTGSGFEVGESSRGTEVVDPFDSLTLKELQDLAAKMGVRYKKKGETRLRNELKNTRDERNRSSFM